MKKVISFIFSFFLAFFLFLLTTITVMRFTVVGETYFMSQLNKTNYYESAVVSYNRLLKQNARPTNFPVELFDNFVNTADVIDDMKAGIKASFRGDTYEADTGDISNRLKQITDGYISDNNLTVNQRTTDAIHTFVDANTDNYAQLLVFPYMNLLSKGIKVFHKVYWIAAILLIVLCAVLTFAQIRMHKSRRRKKRWLAYSLIGAGLMGSVFPAILLGQKIFDRIQIDPEYLYDVIVAVMNGSMMILIFISILWILLGIFLTYFKPNHKKTGKHQERNYDHSVNLDHIIKE